jgi:hypothetical protein
MKNDQLLKTLPRKWRTLKTDSETPLVDSSLLTSLHNQGIDLNNISIDVLKLKTCESKKLYSLGILNLKQLSNTSESALRVVPHFGIMKVRRLKARLVAHLATLTNDISQLPEMPGKAVMENPPAAAGPEHDSQLTSVIEFIAELEAASESLEKLKKHIRLYVAEISKNQE